MCGIILRDRAVPEVVSFKKENWPEPRGIKVLIAPCQCGENLFARVPEGKVWERVERQEGI